MPRRLRGRLLVAVAGLGVAGLALGAAMEGTLVYARTPGQVAHGTPAGQQVRVEGRVVPGTLTEDDGRAAFVLEGGGGRVSVVAREAPPGAFREGRGAVVEGVLGPDGTFAADRVVAQHGNTYRAADGGGSGSEGTGG